MSKDMLGPLTRALVGIDARRLPLMLDIANRMGGDQATAWETRLKEVMREGLPKRQVAGFTRNEHGHVLIKVTGVDLSGAEEVGRLEATGCRVGNYAKSCFTSTNPDGYNLKHRLVTGQEYTVAIVLGTEVERESDRTTENLRKLGEKHGYQKPLAGIIPRIREAVSDEEMKAMNILYIAALHDPIKDSDGYPSVLGAYRGVGGRFVLAGWDYPGYQWYDGGAFAFLVPASPRV